MTGRPGILVDLAPYAVMLLLAFGHPAHAAAQGRVQDTTGASAAAKDLPLTAAQRQSFVGSYSVTMPSGDQVPVRILEENGVLKMQPGNDQPVRLLYQGDNVFQAEGMPDFLPKFVLEGGRATRFTVRKDDGMMVGVRVP